MSFLRLPPLLVEGRLDHLVVSAEGEALLRPAAHRAEHAVGRRHQLLGQRTDLRDSLALIALAPAPARGATSRRVRPGAAISRSLTIGATACDARLEFTSSTRTSTGFLGSSARKTLGVGIALAEMIDAVEDVLGAPVPELAVVEHGVDHRRGVARLDPAGVRRRRRRKPCGSTFITGMMDALRRHGVVAVGGRIERAADARVGEPGEGKVRGLELVVRTGAGRVGEVRRRARASSPGSPGSSIADRRRRGSGSSRRPARRRSRPACPRRAPCRGRAPSPGSLTKSARFDGPGTGAARRSPGRTSRSAERRVGHARNRGVGRGLRCSKRGGHGHGPGKEADMRKPAGIDGVFHPCPWAICSIDADREPSVT